MEWRTNRADVTCDTHVAASDNQQVLCKLPGPLLVRIALWLLIFVVCPLSVTAASLSFHLEVLGRIPYAALPPGAPRVDLAERVLVCLEAAERKEFDPWLRDDIRIAWITTLYASRGNPQPHVDATYRVLGLRPDKVWPAICARRAALLGRLEEACAMPADSTAVPMTDSQGVAATGAPIPPAGTMKRTKKNSTTSTTLTKKAFPPEFSPKKPCASVDRHGKRRAA